MSTECICEGLIEALEISSIGEPYTGFHDVLRTQAMLSQYSELMFEDQGGLRCNITADLTLIIECKLARQKQQRARSDGRRKMWHG